MQPMIYTIQDVLNPLWHLSINFLNYISTRRWTFSTNRSHIGLLSRTTIGDKWRLTDHQLDSFRPTNHLTKGISTEKLPSKPQSSPV